MTDLKMQIMVALCISEKNTRLIEFLFLAKFGVSCRGNDLASVPEYSGEILSVLNFNEKLAIQNKK